MGLAICKQIVNAHGGKISARSSQLTGTRIIVELPIRSHDEQYNELS